MNHKIHRNGIGYRLRPVRIEDAQFIVDVRLEDKDRNRFINTISEDVRLQEEWINRYLERDGDYYFVIENKLTGDKEGLVGIYDLVDGKAEWGRWVVKKGSLCTVESLFLVFQVAFENLELKELFCRTISVNEAVVSLHDSLPQMRRGVLENYLELNGEKYDVVEHYVTPSYFREKLEADLEKKSMFIFQRNFRSILGPLEFHHIGVATDNIEREFEAYRFLGYAREDQVFEDPEQGIRGQFITAAGQPRLELLENLPESKTLDSWLESRIKFYHYAYKVEDIEKVVEVLEKNRIKLLSPLKHSVYFKKRICFLMMSNRFLIELVEK